MGEALAKMGNESAEVSEAAAKGVKTRLSEGFKKTKKWVSKEADSLNKNYLDKYLPKRVAKRELANVLEQSENAAKFLKKTWKRL